MLRTAIRGTKRFNSDDIARRMDDIHRRLDLGRAGPKVKKAEDGVIAALDKMIKKIEEEQELPAMALGQVES